MKGLKSYLLDSEDYDSDKDRNSDNPWAVAQIGILNNRNVPVTIFDGYGELVNVVWNANGQPLLLYDVCYLFKFLN